MKNTLAFRKLLLMSVVIFSLIPFSGCSNTNNVKYNPSDQIDNNQKSQTTKIDKNQNPYQERYQEYYY